MLLDEETRGLKSGDMFDGETAFTLYDTYGFPLDLTQDALRPRGISVDIAAFNAAMERQREGARLLGGSGEAATETIWFGLREKVGATSSSATRPRTPKAWSPRWSTTASRSTALKQGRERRRRAQPDAVLRRERRSGRRHRRDDRRRRALRVTDTQKKLGDLFAHLGTVEQGSQVGDASRSTSIMRGARAIRANIRHASAARGAAPGARRSCGAEGLAGRARAAAFRLLAPQADDSRGT